MQNEKIKTPNDGATTSEVDFITKAVSKQERIEMAKEFLKKLYSNLPPNTNQYAYLWVSSAKNEKKLTLPFKVEERFFEEVAQDAVKFNDRDYNVFIGVNSSATATDTIHRAKKEEISLQTAIVADIDIQSSWHVGEKYPANFDTAKSFLPFEPSILVDSGGGLHSYILLKNPIEFSQNEERDFAVSRNKTYIEMIRQNAGKYAGAVDGVHDLPRVLRLPGTYNLKNGRQNAPLCKVVSTGDSYTLENLRELIKPKVIIPVENSLIKPSFSDTDIYNTNLKNNSKIENPVADSANKTFDDSAEYNCYRALKMLEKIPCSQQTYGDWVAVGMILKNNGNTCADWERWSKTDSARFKVGECSEKWKTFQENGGLTIATLHYFARALYGYSEKETYREYHADKQADEGANSQENDEYKLTTEEKKSLFSFANTDLGNASRLENFCGRDIRFLTDSCRWLTYQQNLWKDGGKDNSAILPYALKLSKIISANAENENDKKLSRQWQMKKTFSASIEVLKGFESIRITEQDLNNHKNLLCCQNGIVDLQTGKLNQHDSKLLITQMINAEYRAGYRNSKVDKFLREVLPDENTLQALLRFLGYCLTGEVSEEKALFIHGEGGNGKSVTTKTLLTLFGDYACGFPIESILTQPRFKDGDSATPAFAKLQWRRLSISEEIPAGRKLDYAKFKILTGGDALPIRKLFQDATEIKNPTHKMIFSGNHLPELDDTHDAGILRRWIQIKFEQDFTQNPDTTLKNFLQTPDALSALLNILVKNAVEWYKDGLIISEKMNQDRENYFAENDFVAEFISEFCERDSQKSIKLKEFTDKLKKEYPSETTGLTSKTLAKMIERIPYVTKRRMTKGNTLFGIGWLDTQELNFDGEPVDDNNISTI